MLVKFNIFIKIIFIKLKFYLKKKIVNFVYIKNKSYQNYYKHLQEIETNGYSIINKYFSETECFEIIKELDNFSQKNKNYLQYNDDHSDIRVFGINNSDILFVSKFHNDQILKDIGENFLQCKINNFFTMFGKTSYKVNNPGSGGGWHRDGINHTYKAMIYLSDVDENNGAFQIIKDSNRLVNIIRDHYYLNNKELLDTRFTDKDIDSLIQKYEYLVNTISGKAGTVLLFDGSLLHRGSPLKKEQRYALTNYYYVSSTKIDPNHFTPMYKEK